MVLLFVQTDCPISNRYAPTIARLHARFQPQGVAFYLVYPDRREDADAIRRHGREYGLPGQALRDVQHILVKRVGATVTPEAVVLGARGQRRLSGPHRRPLHGLRPSASAADPERPRKRPRGRPRWSPAQTRVPPRRLAVLSPTCNDALLDIPSCDLLWMQWRRSPDLQPRHCADCLSQLRLPATGPPAQLPFDLLSYADVSARAEQIAFVTETRYMPPWKPKRGYGSFAGERGLSAEQIAAIRRWVDHGKQEGQSCRPTATAPVGGRVGVGPARFNRPHDIGLRSAARRPRCLPQLRHPTGR